jgi:hypothetical protein
MQVDHPEEEKNNIDYDITPIPEERQFEIEVIRSIQEDSNIKSEVSDVDQSDLEDLLEEDDDAKSVENLLVADENSILEKFLTKRSPKKFNQPDNLKGKDKTLEASFKDDLSQIVQTEYNVDSMANNLSHDEITEKMHLEEIRNEEANEVLEDHPKRWLIPTSKVVVCPSGFNIKIKEKINETVTKLGGTFNFDFTEKINVLISKDNHSEKYKIARKMFVNTVTAQWLKDSAKYDYFLNPEEYLFPLFYEYKFHFYDCETKELVNRVREFRAEVVVDIDSTMLNYLYIVIPNKDIENYIEVLRREYSFFESAFEENTLKLVTVPWIEAYINKEYNILDSYQVFAADYQAPSEEARCSLPCKSVDRIQENRKSNKLETKVLQKFIKEQERDIEEHIGKLRQEPDFRKTMFLLDANISMHNVHDKEDRTSI